jgi:hypothetical protein
MGVFRSHAEGSGVSVVDFVNPIDRRVMQKTVKPVVPAIFNDQTQHHLPCIRLPEQQDEEKKQKLKKEEREKYHEGMVS